MCRCQRGGEHSSPAASSHARCGGSIFPSLSPRYCAPCAPQDTRHCACNGQLPVSLPAHCMHVRALTLACHTPPHHRTPAASYATTCIMSRSGAAALRHLHQLHPTLLLRQPQKNLSRSTLCLSTCPRPRSHHPSSLLLLAAHSALVYSGSMCCEARRQIPYLLQAKHLSTRHCDVRGCPVTHPPLSSPRRVPLCTMPNGV